MAKCDTCGTTIIFGGKKEGSFRFCNDKCYKKGGGLLLVNQIPDDVVDEMMLAVHQGACPLCEGPGPVDVHMSYEIWSALIMTSFKSIPHVCCQGCGQKKRFIGIIGSFFLGWWGFPWGILMTPVQIVRNIIGMVSLPDTSIPSVELENVIRLDLAEKMHKEQALQR